MSLARSGADAPSSPLIEPPAAPARWLRPALWLTRKLTGRTPLPARLLAHWPKGAVGFGLMELSAAHAPGDLEGRVLVCARVVASVSAGCPFCVDMNAATWRQAGLTPQELEALLAQEPARWQALGQREALAARYARALSLTPVVLSQTLTDELRAAFSARELVILAATIAQVNAWSRLNQGLGVPPEGFFDAGSCPLPAAATRGWLTPGPSSAHGRDA